MKSYLRFCLHLKRNSPNICRSAHCLGQKLRNETHIVCPPYIDIRFVESRQKGAEGRSNITLCIHF